MLSIRVMTPILGAAVLLHGCSAPYDLKISSINEARFPFSRDAPAIIQLSDPQLFSREALINDRRAERSYLDDLLEGSKTIAFGADLQRELLSIVSAAAQLSVAFDPGSALGYNLDKDKAQLQQEVDVARLQIELRQLQDQLRGLDRVPKPAAVVPAVDDAAAAPAVDAGAGLAEIPASGVTPVPASALAGRGPTPPDVSQVIAQVDKLDAKLERLLATEFPLARAAQLQPNPRDLFHDRQAYRRDLRAALGEVNLDDLHDLEGNSLYRMQFRATVLPGERKDKWGVAQLNVEAPKVTRRELGQLYFAWLDHNTYRLNVSGDRNDQSRSTNLPDQRYQMLATGTGLFEVARLYFDPNLVESRGADPCAQAKTEREAEALGCDHVMLALPPGMREFVSPPFPNYDDIGLDLLVEGLATAMVRRNTEDLAGLEYFNLKRATTTQSSGDLGILRGSSPMVACEVDQFTKTLLFEKDAGLGIDFLQEGKHPLEILADSVDEKILKNIQLDEYTEEMQNIDENTKKTTMNSENTQNNTQGYFKIVELYKSLDGDKERVHGNFTLDVIDTRKAANIILKSEKEILRKLFESAKGLSLEKRAQLFPPDKALGFTKRFLRAAPAIAAAVKGIVGRRDLPDNVKKKAVSILATLEETSHTARQYVKLLGKVNKDCYQPALPGREFVEQKAADLEECPSSGGFFAHLACALGDKKRPSAEEMAAGPAAEPSNAPSIVGDLLDRPEVYESRGKGVPELFCRTLVKEADFSKCKVIANPNGATEGEEAKLTLRGDPFTYAASPIELAQRVSSVANAAEAFQLALALSGVIPGQGISGTGGFGYSQSAVGKVQALERAPLVVGFSGLARDPRSEGAGAADAKTFGWVFGPRVRLDPAQRKLVLEHGLTNYGVTADLSLPGWWPWVDLRLHTSWVGNWFEGDVVKLRSPDKAEKLLEVRLPLNRADLDGLTNHITKETLGREVQLTRINRVVPSEISVCSGDVTLLIYGANVWRGTEVHLVGQPAKNDSIRVLPDMEGISATFEMARLDNLSHELDVRKLVVWTQDGYDEFPMTVTGGFGADGKCADKKAPRGPKPLLAERTEAEKVKEPSVQFVSPTIISACDKTATFLVQTSGLQSITGGFLGSVGSARSVAVQPPAFKDGKETGYGLTQLSFVGLDAANEGLTSVTLTVKGGGTAERGASLATASIKVEGDRNNCGKSKPPATVAVSNLVMGSGSTLDACRGSAGLVLMGQSLDQVVTAKLFGNQVTPTYDAKTRTLKLAFDVLPSYSKERRPPDSTLLELSLRNGQSVTQSVPLRCGDAA